MLPMSDEHLPEGGEERLSTGIPGLDNILCGGLDAERLYLVEGEPGTGKTTLALQFGHSNPFSVTVDALVGARFPPIMGWCRQSPAHGSVGIAAKFREQTPPIRNSIELAGTYVGAGNGVRVDCRG